MFGCHCQAWPKIHVRSRARITFPPHHCRSRTCCPHVRARSATAPRLRPPLRRRWPPLGKNERASERDVMRQPSCSRPVVFVETPFGAGGREVRHPIPCPGGMSRLGEARRKEHGPAPRAAAHVARHTVRRTHVPTAKYRSQRPAGGAALRTHVRVLGFGWGQRLGPAGRPGGRINHHALIDLCNAMPMQVGYQQ